ncbi:nucleotidyltransferase family protein [Maribacter sp. TH_r10]|uniref:nucleotidyltransferase family protein n=1 Tax=Maribacter sp. TH_r10 TaxID=3082086 RepID=UPI0029554536|nr:nucleotidyltransferase family protein [Maribacter sp. TH_r10]MDV7138828.1 nucleotidyltransferase family protein [Maribacter sp. TH_r10]
MGKSTNIAIVILAAGESSRMQQPKQLLPWGETTLLGQAIETAKTSSAHEVFVVLGANSEMILRQIDRTQINIVLNDNWKKGMGSSISCAVKELIQSKKQFDGLLFMLCDQPFIDTAYLNTMISTFIDEYNDIVATAYENGNGVPVLYDQRFIPDLEKLDGIVGAKEILLKNTQSTTNLKPKGKEIDLDTYEEYLYYLKQSKKSV